MANGNQQQGNSRGPLIAIGAVVLLVVVALIVVHELTAASHVQDCLLSGRTDCAPIAPSAG